MTTQLVGKVLPYDSQRYTWRLETAHGKFVVVESGTAYLRKKTALSGLRRFVRTYFKPDAPVVMP